jgi:hypothetical protein
MLGQYHLLGGGATSAKFATKIIGASGRKITLIFERSIGTFIEFGDRGVLRRALKPAASHHAHHVIPWSKRYHEVVQSAAEVAWHPNDPLLNGIPVLESRHINPTGSYDYHPSYDDRVSTALTNWANSHPGYSPQQAYDFLQELSIDIREAIINNPSTHINNIIF